MKEHQQERAETKGADGRFTPKVYENQRPSADAHRKDGKAAAKVAKEYLNLTLQRLKIRRWVVPGRT
jgi:hypothetical protein